MNTLTCEQVEEQLDLLAAGECDRPTRRAVEAHLESCPACTASCAESQRIQGMLDLHWNEAGRQEQLRRRIDEADRAARRPRPRVLPFVNRVASLAALLLVTFGLALMLPNWKEPAPGGGLALLVKGDGVQKVRGGPAVGPEHALADAATARFAKKEVVLALPEAERGEEARHRLRNLQSKGELPPPPPVGLELELKNTGVRPLEVRLGGDESDLSLDVKGPGVLRLPAPSREAPPLLRPQTLRLAPGASHLLPLERLIAGSRGHVEYVYLTEPGEYPLTVRLPVKVNGEPAELTRDVLLRVPDK
jgi:hypothetical protein